MFLVGILKIAETFLDKVTASGYEYCTYTDLYKAILHSCDIFIWLIFCLSVLSLYLRPFVLRKRAWIDEDYDLAEFLCEVWWENIICVFHNYWFIWLIIVGISGTSHIVTYAGSACRSACQGSRQEPCLQP